ncbi:MAG: 30S ribosomal protein S4 [Proteobacteria bacterium]|nr:30S ribosomal protein S4 [Pseudomonadota bacterium]
MTKINKRKYLFSRRFGESLWGDSKDAVHSRNYPPGVHGRSGYKKLTDYGAQLFAKQKLKFYYGRITERQFRNIYKEAERRKGDSGQNLVGLLESRLDAFCYRAWFFEKSIFFAAQFVSHKHVLVNGRSVNIKSYRLKPGDIVSIREKSRDLEIVKDAMKSPLSPLSYVERIDSEYSAKYVQIPSLQDIPYSITMNLNFIVEFYSM